MEQAILKLCAALEDQTRAIDDLIRQNNELMQAHQPEPEYNGTGEITLLSGKRLKV